MTAFCSADVEKKPLQPPVSTTSPGTWSQAGSRDGAEPAAQGLSPSLCADLDTPSPPGKVPPNPGSVRLGNCPSHHCLSLQGETAGTAQLALPFIPPLHSAVWKHYWPSHPSYLIPPLPNKAAPLVRESRVSPRGGSTPTPAACLWQQNRVAQAVLRWGKRE